MDVTLKIVYTFNKLYGNFLRDIKGCHADIRKKVKANYKIIVKDSPQYLNFFWDGFSQHESNIDPSNKSLLEIEVFKEIKLGDIISNLGTTNVAIVWNYIYILSALAMVYGDGAVANGAVANGAQVKVDGTQGEVDGTQGEVDGTQVEVDGTQGEVDGTHGDADGSDDAKESPKEATFNKVIKIFTNALKGENTSIELQEIIDDDLQSVLSKLTKTDTEPKSGETSAQNDDIFNMFSSLENSKICNLAKEISKDIDISNLQVDSPQDIMKLMDFSSGNNMLQNIIGKVSTKMQEKISSGEIKHEDLLGEVMNMMGMMQKSGAASTLFNNPILAETLKNMKKGKVATRTDVLKKASTRDRLRRKLEKKAEQERQQ